MYRVQGEGSVKIRVRVGTSCIAGQGFFTEQEINKDTQIIQYIERKITCEELTV